MESNISLPNSPYLFCNQMQTYNLHSPGESGGNPAALTIVVFHSLGSPVEVIGARTERGSVLSLSSTEVAGQMVHPGEEVIFEPPEQFQHQEVFYSNFTF